MPASLALSRRALAVYRTWCRRVRQRRELRDADPRTLAELGLAPSQARFLADRPFWRD